MTTAVESQSRELLQKIDHIHHECLLVERIGISGMAILESGRLQEAYRRKVTGFQRVEEVLDIVLMVGRIALPSDCRSLNWDGHGSGLAVEA